MSSYVDGNARIGTAVETTGGTGRLTEMGNGADLDVRCSGDLDRRAAGEGRCQQFMGHDGAHAVMFSRGRERFLRSWSRHDTSHARDDLAQQQQHPWMPGFPTPAWTESATNSHTSVLPNAGI